MCRAVFFHDGSKHQTVQKKKKLHLKKSVKQEVCSDLYGKKKSLSSAFTSLSGSQTRELASSEVIKPEEEVCHCIYGKFSNVDSMKCSQGSNVLYLISVKMHSQVLSFLLKRNDLETQLDMIHLRINFSISQSQTRHSQTIILLGYGYGH